MRRIRKADSTRREGKRTVGGWVAAQRAQACRLLWSRSVSGGVWRTRGDLARREQDAGGGAEASAPTDVVCPSGLAPSPLAWLCLDWFLGHENKTDASAAPRQQPRGPSRCLFGSPRFLIAGSRWRQTRPSLPSLPSLVALGIPLRTPEAQPSGPVARDAAPSILQVLVPPFSCSIQQADCRRSSGRAPRGARRRRATHAGCMAAWLPACSQPRPRPRAWL